MTLYAHELWQYAHRLLGNSYDADDVLQEAFFRAVRGIERFRGDATFRTWMYQIVHNVAVDLLRKKDPTPTLPIDALDPDERDQLLWNKNEVTLAEILADRTDLKSALELLAPEDRAAILLVEADGFSLRQAAKVLGVSYQTVSRRCERARMLIRAIVITAVEDPPQ